LLAENAEQSIHLIVTDSLEAFLPLAGLLDVAKEKQRLGKQATKLEAEVAGLRKRLSASSVSCSNVQYSTVQYCMHCFSVTPQQISKVSGDS